MSSPNQDPMQILNELTKNPEALKSIMSAFPTNTSSPANEENTANPSHPDNAPMPDFSKMLSDPQAIARISGIISMLKNSGSNEATPASVSASASVPTDKSAALLLALKPYLSSDRQTAIENLIKFSKFGEILKNM